MAQAKIRIVPGRRSGLSSMPGFNAPQTGAATFRQGAPVKLTSGLLAAVSTANAGTGSGMTYVKKSSTSTIIGISNGLAVASSSNNLLVSRIVRGIEFEGNLLHTTASSAKTSKVGSTVYLAKINSASDVHWGWSKEAPGASSASYVQGAITELIDAASTVNGRVLAEVTTGGLYG